MDEPNGIARPRLQEMFIYDGHERADVVIYQEIFFKEIIDLCKHGNHYDGKMKDQIVYAECERVYHAELTIHTNE